jgi:hypothetical protein
MGRYEHNPLAISLMLFDEIQGGWIEFACCVNCFWASAGKLEKVQVAHKGIAKVLNHSLIKKR